jgi:hypothetical protein
VSPTSNWRDSGRARPSRTDLICVSEREPIGVRHMSRQPCALIGRPLSLRPTSWSAFIGSPDSSAPHLSLDLTDARRRSPACDAVFLSRTVRGHGCVSRPRHGTIASPAHPVASTPRGGSDAGERASISVGCSGDRCASSLKQSQSAVRVARRSNIWARASRSGHGRGVTLDGRGPYKCSAARLTPVPKHQGGHSP